LPDDRAHLPAAAFDLLFASMVLHHIVDIDRLFSQFHAALGPGGYLAIADLDKEDGTFHDDPHGIAHQGFDRPALMTMLRQLGFVDLHERTVHVMHKERREGMRSYPVFLLTGKKP
jgi:trans-aconitate methyltransferase